MSTLPTPAPAARPVEVDIEPPVVVFTDGSDHPIDVKLAGDVFGFTLDEALELAGDLIGAVLRARDAAAAPFTLPSELDS